MITDARVLRTNFVPREVEHRDAEVTHLTEILAPLTDGDPADTTLLLGPSGVGKTCLAKYTAEQLRQEVLDVEYQYVNCWQNVSEFRTIYRIFEGLGKTVDIHRQLTPRPNSTNASASTTAHRVSSSSTKSTSSKTRTSSTTSTRCPTSRCSSSPTASASYSPAPTNSS